MHPGDTGPDDPGFVSDLLSTLRVLQDRPVLPIVSLVVWTAPALLPPTLGILALPIEIFSIGFPGTQRLWLFRGFRGEEFGWGDAFRVTWGYIGRFLILGLVTAPLIIVGGLVGLAVSRDFFGLFIGFGLGTLLVDFALTFVTPALALLTRRVSKALSTGLGLIAADWPRTALYVLVPPLVLVVLGNLVMGAALARDLDRQFDAVLAGRSPHPGFESFESIRPISAGLAALGALLGLWFKGAAVAFFMRRFEVSPFGASGPPPGVPPRPDQAEAS